MPFNRLVRQRLPQRRDRFSSYQLLRNVLAAHALQCSFCVVIDGRRTDLADEWSTVMSCVMPVELRIRLRIATWQELAQFTPSALRKFLIAKYGISPSWFFVNLFLSGTCTFMNGVPCADASDNQTWAIASEPCRKPL